jgi:hypothetical protein
VDETINKRLIYFERKEMKVALFRPIMCYALPFKSYIFIDFREEGKVKDRNINDERESLIASSTPPTGDRAPNLGMWKLNRDLLVHKLMLNH